LVIEGQQVFGLRVVDVGQRMGKTGRRSLRGAKEPEAQILGIQLPQEIGQLRLIFYACRPKD
jgi:hypothetical protein